MRLTNEQTDVMGHSTDLEGSGLLDPQGEVKTMVPIRLPQQPGHWLASFSTGDGPCLIRLLRLEGLQVHNNYDPKGTSLVLNPGLAALPEGSYQLWVVPITPQKTPVAADPQSARVSRGKVKKGIR